MIDNINDDDNNDDDNNNVILDAQVVALFPPRPDAIMTLWDSDDLLPGIQTLLYSLKKTSLSSSSTTTTGTNIDTQQQQEEHQRLYPPEVVVLVTPNVSQQQRNAMETLWVPALCTRFLDIPVLPAPVQSIDDQLGQTTSNASKNNNKHCFFKRTLNAHHNPEDWTLLQLFGLQQYETLVYVDADCLILKDISGLLDLNKVYTEAEALIAAAPDVLPPHHFNVGVMVIRPSTRTLNTMKRQSSILTTFGDGSCQGFLNAYFSNWYTDFPPSARLPVGYNAQQAMWDMTMDQDNNNNNNNASSSSSFWDVHIASDLYIVHYSNDVKPWQTTTKALSKDNNNNNNNNTHPLHALWKTWHQKSKNYLQRYAKEHPAKSTSTTIAARAPAPPPPRRPVNPAHQNVQKRYKELRKQGKSTQDAMAQARRECLPANDISNMNVGSQVAAMFGMGSIM